MIKTMQIVSFVLAALLLLFTADGRNFIVFPETRSESSSENHREYSPDEVTLRNSHAAQSGITHHARVGSRHLGKQLRGSDNLFTSALKKSAVNKESSGIARIQILCTVLRI
jgi:hypothetical protein